jgi:hypothetical protein
MRNDTRQRKHAMAGLRAIAGEERMLGTLVRVIRSGKLALDAVMLEMGRMVAERSCCSSERRSRDPTTIRPTQISSSGRMRRARSLSATKRSG